MVDISDCTGHSRKSSLARASRASSDSRAARTSRATSDSRKDAWSRVKLGEVCEFVYGYPFDSAKFNNDGNGKALIRIRDVLPGESKTFTTEVPPAKYNVSKGDLLVGMDGDFNVARWRSDDAWLNQRVCMFKPDEQKLLSGYIEFASGKYLSEIWENKAFSTVKHLSAKDLNAIEIPLPPLVVQHEIVVRLEKDLAMVERMAKGFAALKAEADQLFKSTLKETFEEVSRGGAETRRLGDVCRFIDYRGMTPTKTEDGIPLITARNIRFGYMDYRERFYISKDDYLNRQSRGVAHRGDILFTTEAPMGFVAIADQEVFSTGQRIITFQWPDQARHNNRYFLYYFMSDVFQTQLRENASGATAQGIKASRLVNLNVLIPPLPTQRKIVAKLDAVRERCEKLKRAAEEGAQTAALMRKAILKEAFA